MSEWRYFVRSAKCVNKIFAKMFHFVDAAVGSCDSHCKCSSAGICKLPDLLLDFQGQKWEICETRELILLQRDGIGELVHLV